MGALHDGFWEDFWVGLQDGYLVLLCVVALTSSSGRMYEVHMGISLSLTC
jgi:hypothetical protein